MDVAVWLRTLGLERYEAVFRENDINPVVLPGLTAEDLKDLGVTSVGHRRQLLDAIAALHMHASLAGGSSQVPGSSATRSSKNDRSSGLTAERRQLSVMFCDITGFTQLSTRLDPEDLSQVIRRYQACVATTIARFDGFIARYVGDGVLIYFGYPRAQEDDAERAVRAGLAVVTAINETPTLNQCVRVRIGIATGLVVVGEQIGTGEARQQTAIGETPNLAARLQGLAEPDTVVIAETTRRLVGDLFEYRDLGTVEVKGFDAAVPVWQVQRASTIESRSEALYAAPAPALMGSRPKMARASCEQAECRQSRGNTNPHKRNG
jgi:class 3 adenylate cyclase